MESTRNGFGHALLELAEQRDDILAASADTYRSFALNDFVEQYKDRYYEFGIAEQCMITTSAAMASEGYQVFCVGYSPFLSMRAVEQIRTFVCYPNLNVKIVAGLSGLSGDTDGVTHQGTEDISIIRSIPNIILVNPADAVAARELTKKIAETKSPAYLRLGRGATPVIYEEAETKNFSIGKAHLIRDYGTDAAVIATGCCVAEAMRAADSLHDEGIHIRVLDMHTIKPLDEEAVMQCARECGRIVTVEDNSIYGGLGGAVAEVLTENGIRVDAFRRLGMTSFGTSGSLPELLHFFGMDREAIIKVIRS